MVHSFNYGDQCWWCGTFADSAEHKYKKSDLVREFGNGPYKRQDEVVRVSANQLRKVLGPNSKEVKFHNNLCQPCNNDRSQPFDRAYDQFVAYLRDYEEEIYTRKQFKLSAIFGAAWETDKKNIIKYYVKHICCRLASAGILISDDLRDYLNDQKHLKCINLHMEVREDIVAYIKTVTSQGINSGGLWIGDLLYILNEKTGAMRDMRSFIGYRWLRTSYVYDESIMISTTPLDKDVVILGSGYNVNPDEINGFNGMTLK